MALKSKREKRKAEKLLRALAPKKMPTGTPGPLERTPFKWSSKKDRRHDGRVSSHILYPQMKWKQVHQEALEPEEFYDEWQNYRDGFRDISRLPKEEVKELKAKLKKRAEIHKLRKQLNKNDKGKYK